MPPTLQGPSSSNHWLALTIALGGTLTAGGLILQARGAKELGTLLYVCAVLGTTIIASLRCYEGQTS